MSKMALSDAYAAGFQDGRASAVSVRDEDAGDHCALGFDGWWQEAVDGVDRSPTRSSHPSAGPATLTLMVQPMAKPNPVSVVIKGNGDWIEIDEFMRMADQIRKMQDARK